MKGILLAIALASASVGIQAKELPPNDEIIANLSKFSKKGYSAGWKDMESGGKTLKVDGGSFYINDKGAFVIVAVAGDSEAEMSESFIKGLAMCTHIGMAAIGKDSKEVREVLVDTLVSSTQVSASVSETVWGYRYEAKMQPLGTGAIWFCGIYR